MTRKNKRFFRRLKYYIPKATVIIVIIALIAAVLHLTSIYSPTFADFWNDNIASVLRTVTAYLTSWIPFSLAEFFIISSPIWIVIISVFAVKRAEKGKIHFVRTIVGLLSVVLVVYSAFVFTFGISYRTSTLDKRLDMPREKVSADDLYNTVNIVIEELNSLSNEVVYALEKGSIRPYSHSECVDLCVKSYEDLSEKYGFIRNIDVPVKQIMLSDLMTYTHISGVYTFFTGEANLNTNYPYYVNVYTTAHEMAHQRGIARENEANFIAYLVCINSDDPFMRYSGYLNMYEYLVSPLYKASPTLYGKAVRQLDPRVRYDLDCYSAFFDKYRDNIAADVSDTVNNTYLQIQGTEEGSKSYGMVVDLAVAYHRPEFPIEAETEATE